MTNGGIRFLSNIQLSGTMMATWSIGIHLSLRAAVSKLLQCHSGRYWNISASSMATIAGQPMGYQSQERRKPPYVSFMFSGYPWVNRFNLQGESPSAPAQNPHYNSLQRSQTWYVLLNYNAYKILNKRSGATHLGRRPVVRHLFLDTVRSCNSHNPLKLTLHLQVQLGVYGCMERP